MEKVPWNRVILDEFCSLALLTPLEENIIRTRAAGWSQAKQCHKFCVSQATITRTIKKLRIEYEFCRKYSDKLPENLKF
nr:MAG TPA: HTH-type transcriptional regulator [Caudoviricetes sp.]